MAGFWSDVNVEPKRSNRFVLISNNIGSWVIKAAGKPSYEVGESEHKYLNHTFYFPGILAWQELEVTLVDPIGEEDSTKKVMEMLFNAGYDIPTADGEAGRGLISKVSATSALGNITIQELGIDGAVVNQWSLGNAWVKSAKFGELTYSEDGLTEVTLSIRYDWAKLGDAAAPSLIG